tara:strand:- start:3242 stop:3601 length:360 start_codon:yes stop_codon:yes gene_type:complete
MAHFAQINENNIVVQVLVVDNSVLKHGKKEVEQKGIDFLHSLYGSDKTWVQTSYNNNIRKQYAGVGDTYDLAKDKFILPQPFPSWALDSNDDWQPPVPKPEDDPLAQWNEESQSWESRE